MAGTLKKVDIQNGETIAYRERPGGDEPLVLLHSNLVSSKHWDLLFEELDSKYTMYGVDMRGFGESSYRTRISSIGDLAEDVHLLADELGLSRFHLLGWSTGGAVAMQYAATYPGSVDRLVLMAPVSTREMYPVSELDEDGNSIPDSPLLEREAVAQHPQVKMLERAQRDVDHETLRDFWDEAVYVNNRPDPERYAEYLDDMGTQRNLADVRYAIANFNISDVDDGHTTGTGEVNNITHPTLIMTGELDDVIPRDLIDKTASDIGSNARVVELQDCGHNPMIDDLALAVETIESFLSK